MLPEFNIRNLVCNKCNKVIDPEKLHRVILDVAGDRFTDHHYEHVECPGEITV